MMDLQTFAGSKAAPFPVNGFELAADLGPTRDRQIVAAALGGGVRPWSWVQVPLEGGRGYFEVASDYLALGNESNWTRVPIGGPSAQVIAEYFQACLPCAFMVDLIWKAADVKLTPQPFQDLSGMTTTRRFAEHNALIEKQRNGRNGLIAGCKKDVVVSNRLLTYPQAVCIYGWHQSNGKPIQPVSTAHREWWYTDYSHGIRLINRQMVLDGQTVDVEAVLRDPARAHVLTGGKEYAARTQQNDAVLQVTRYNTALLGGEVSAPPQVQQPASVAPQTTEPARAPAAESARAPDPTTANSDLGVRALDWCLHELQSGVKEEPPGSNAGARIAEYFRPARRRANGGLIGISSGDWCAVAQSAAMAAVARAGEPVPHGYRAAVWELREDANESGAWVPVEDLRSARYQLQRGDLLVWSRGQPGSKLGHVSRVDVPPAGNGDVVTVGGNENNAWTRRTRSLGEAELQGAIKYRDYRRIDFDEKRPALPAQPPVQRVNFVQPAAPAPRAPEQPSSATSPNETIDRILTADGWMRFEEDYLPRVVTGENGHAHPEALKAQAVASRTYVLRAMRDDRSIGRTVPVPNSQKFQVYSRGAFPQCIAAVEATRGEVARYQGRLVIANYVAGALWVNGRPGNDPTNTERWVTYNEGRTGKSVLPTKLSHTGRSDNRGCMSQNGADWLARAGRTYKEILRFFYGADLELGSDQKQPAKEGAVIMMPAVHIQNVMPRQPIVQNAFVRRSSVVMPRNGIEALAASNGPMPMPAPAPAPRANMAGAPRIAVGSDPLQMELEAVRVEMEGLNDQMGKAGQPFGDQWGLYVQSFNVFFQRNYQNTPDRQADAMQTAFKYREGIKQWAYALAVRMEQMKSSKYEGKTHPDGFPVLPTLGLVALVGAAAVMVTMASK